MKTIEFGKHHYEIRDIKDGYTYILKDGNSCERFQRLENAYWKVEQKELVLRYTNSYTPCGIVMT